MKRLNLVWDGLQRLHLRMKLMQDAAQEALGTEIARQAATSPIALRPGDQSTRAEQECLARVVAEAIANAPVSLQAKADWLRITQEGFSLSSRLMAIMRMQTPGWVETIPEGLLTRGFGVDPTHLEIAELSGVMREFYYQARNEGRAALRRELPAITEVGTWGRGLRTVTDSQGKFSLIEPYPGTPVLSGARAS
jgi:hypothetical protein